MFYIDSLSLVVLLLLAGQHQLEAHSIVFSHNSPTPKRVIDKDVMTDEEKKDEVMVQLKLELEEKDQQIAELKDRLAKV